MMCLGHAVEVVESMFEERKRSEATLLTLRELTHEEGKPVETMTLKKILED